MSSPQCTGFDELSKWMMSWMSDQLDEETFSFVYGTLKANQFTTRLKIKLISDDQVTFMFPNASLGTKAVIKYQIQLLRDESPLATKTKVSKAKSTVTEAASKEKPAKKNVLKALQYEEQRLTDKIRKAKDELQEFDINIESMDITVKEPPNLGTSRTVCGNCHHRGHRNQSSNACKYDKCTDYTYCGIRDKHPEYFSRLNSLKTERKKKKDLINELENQVKSMNQFSSSSEHQFIKNLTPRLYKVDNNYRTNKPKLMRDVRMIREHLGGKIPPETTNDEEQLRLLIRKCKKGLSLYDHEDSDSELSDSSTSSDSSVEDRKRKKHKKKAKRKKKSKGQHRDKSSFLDSPVKVAPTNKFPSSTSTTNTASTDNGNSYPPYMNYYSPFPGYGMGTNNPAVNSLNNNPYNQFPNQPFQMPTAIYQHYTPPFQHSIPPVASLNTTNIHQVSLGQGSPNSKNKLECPNSQFGNLDTLATAADMVE